MTPFALPSNCGGCGASFPTLAASPVRRDALLGSPAGERPGPSPARRESSRHGSGRSVRRAMPGRPRDHEESAGQPPGRGFDRAPIGSDVARRAFSVRLPGHRHYGDAALGRLLAPYVGSRRPRRAMRGRERGGP